tara:strand:- start:2583 stop:3137 length:555 start_codon:yes stop_codon:yes gene_type:complete
VGKVTGSRIAAAIKGKGDALIYEMIAEIMTGYRDEGDYVSDDMTRGLELESEARELYEERTGLQVNPIGFIQSEQYPLLGISPDGAVSPNGSIEIKCPRSKTHIKYLREGGVPSEYNGQVLIEFIINPDLEWKDFVSYDPRIESKPMYIYRTTRSAVAVELASMEVALVSFFQRLEDCKIKIFI